MIHSYKDKVSGRTLYTHIDQAGSKRYYKERELWTYHREDGPSVEFTDGSTAWHQNGLLHRLDGPAVSYVTEGTRYWYIDGVLLNLKVLREQLKNL